jgi:CheY-like chemotaxis protein
LTKPLKASHLYNALAQVFALQPLHVKAARGDAAEMDEEMGVRHPLRILLAEDSAINQKLVLIILERLGYRADVAGNGLEVIEALERQAYDTILMDVQMPDMDGLDAARQIRARFPAGRQPHIIAMTANAMQGDRELCLAAGMNDYVSKPIQVQELVKALKQAPRLELEGGRRKLEVAQPNLQAQRSASSLQSPISQNIQSSAIDLAAFDRLRATLGKKADALLPGLIDNFFKDAQRLISAARQALDDNQPEALRRAAHTLKSNARNFGANTLGDVCQELESLAKDGATDGAADLIGKMETEYERARTELEALRKTMA